ncbi:hypothetical protein WN944_020318 [Citrus x changshan-huyou]|uniref:Uncharacterized protein n=1 Tax=Citrus x changshan-huyou TaxID=2935761 RepID=A0AAP0QGQ3_9ROSI
MAVEDRWGGSGTHEIWTGMSLVISLYKFVLFPYVGSVTPLFLRCHHSTTLSPLNWEVDLQACA